MSEQRSSSDLHKLMFINLVTMLSMSAMQQLGKIKNPVTGKTEVYLEAAQATIDMLDMLETKTSGNLEKDEARLLKDTLSSLKLNYVETAEMEQSKQATAPTDAKTAQGKQEAGEKTESAEPSTADSEQAEARAHKDPKFHKSYE